MSDKILAEKVIISNTKNSWRNDTKKNPQTPMESNSVQHEEAKAGKDFLHKHS